MKYLSSAFLLLSMSVVSGCTVMGAAADIALANTTSNSGKHESSSNRKDTGFEFAKMGLKSTQLLLVV